MLSKAPSRAEPVSELRSVKIVENGDPMVDFLVHCPDLLLDRSRFDYRRETLMRQSLAERLCRANARLPKGYRLAILEGWRAPIIQQRMYKAVWKQFSDLHPDWSETKMKRVVNQFSAPMDAKVPPPHTTGGAVDLALVDADGRAYDVSTPFEWKDPLGFGFDAKGLSEGARRHRDILAEALIAEGVTNYPSEYWHWSYGDQGWAYRGGNDHALYGAITPEGWAADARDVTDLPLEFIE